MTTSRFIKGFIVSFILFVVLDGLWHGGLMVDFYSQRVLLLNPGSNGVPPTATPFIIFLEAINAVTLTYVLFRGAKPANPLQDALWIGALLGFTVSVSINFLNHSLIPFWDIQLALVDTAWGTVMGAIVAFFVVSLCPSEKHRGLFGFLHRR